jgi:hypothetical protein
LNPLELETNGSVLPHLEISRILTAAVINRSFCNLLLTNPAKAISAGYRGQSFHLPKDERVRLVSIHASSLAEFAAQIG